MIEIKNILLEKDIIKEEFACDLAKCKGACCTFPGENGAPLKDDEIYKLEASVEIAKEYLSDRNIKYIEANGIFDGSRGSYTTKVINNRDCVFVYFDGDIARCALEKAYFEGKLDFRKPISCHLFPIRVSNFGGNYLYYQRISECKTGRKKGKKDGIKLYEFLKDSLKRAYGDDWFKALEDYLEKGEGGSYRAPDFWEVK